VRFVLAAVAIALLVPAVALAKSRVYLEDAVPSGSSTSVTITTHEAASFQVLLRVPTAGRAKLFLSGKNLHRSSPLMDTKTYACDGAAGSFYCKARYESLPEGKYTWRITWMSVTQAGPKMPAHVELTVRW
jgi:hypothetical protein